MSSNVNNETGDSNIDGVIVVVAKCPIQGKSKTRLIPLLGPDGSVDLAKAMLSDVVLTIDKCPQLRFGVNKVLLYAPGNDDGLQRMKTILDELSVPYHGGDEMIDQRQRPRDENQAIVAANCTRKWTLLPMMMMDNDVGGCGDGGADGADGDLRSSDLGSKLQDALVRARELMMTTTTTSGGKSEKEDRGGSFGGDGGGGIIFLGMDSPVLSLDDIVQGLQDSSVVSSSPSSFHNQAYSSSHSTTTTSSNTTPQLSAMLCPADDGGYGMLCVPPTADPSVTFQDVYWSHPLTAISQIKALTDQGIMVKIGKCMNDIDEPDDVRALCKRLAVPTTAVETNDDGEDRVSRNNDNNKNNNNNNQNLIATKNLHRRSTTTAYNSTTGAGVVVSSHHPTCYYTKLALQRSGMLT
mmetsp:Transcript_10723/g.25554  ORF Transcript_10723/g.25554 Transcript_10723/m.25554 type:complete len:409 (-) Transcript_10723:68-1294(-)